MTVPAGLHGGDNVRFQAGEGTYAARIPPGMQPGQSFKVDLGSMALAQRPGRIQVRVSVPNGVGPGDSFEFTHFGKTFEAKVPAGFHPGDQVEVGLPADMSSVPAGFDSAAGVNTLAEVAPVASVQAEASLPRLTGSKADKLQELSRQLQAFKAELKLKLAATHASKEAEASLLSSRAWGAGQSASEAVDSAVQTGVDSAVKKASSTLVTAGMAGGETEKSLLAQVFDNNPASTAEAAPRRHALTQTLDNFASTLQRKLTATQQRERLERERAAEKRAAEKKRLEVQVKALESKLKLQLATKHVRQALDSADSKGATSDSDAGEEDYQEQIRNAAKVVRLAEGVPTTAETGTDHAPARGHVASQGQGQPLRQTVAAVAKPASPPSREALPAVPAAERAVSTPSEVTDAKVLASSQTGALEAKVKELTEELRKKEKKETRAAHAEETQRALLRKKEQEEERLREELKVKQLEVQLRETERKAEGEEAAVAEEKAKNAQEEAARQALEQAAQQQTQQHALEKKKLESTVAALELKLQHEEAKPRVPVTSRATDGASHSSEVDGILKRAMGNRAAMFKRGGRSGSSTQQQTQMDALEKQISALKKDAASLESSADMDSASDSLTGTEDVSPDASQEHRQHVPAVQAKAARLSAEKVLEKQVGALEKEASSLESSADGEGNRADGLSRQDVAEEAAAKARAAAERTEEARVAKARAMVVEAAAAEKKEEKKLAAAKKRAAETKNIYIHAAAEKKEHLYEVAIEQERNEEALKKEQQEKAAYAAKEKARKASQLKALQAERQRLAAERKAAKAKRQQRRIQEVKTLEAKLKDKEIALLQGKVQTLEASIEAEKAQQPQQPAPEVQQQPQSAAPAAAPGVSAAAAANTGGAGQVRKEAYSRFVQKVTAIRAAAQAQAAAAVAKTEERERAQAKALRTAQEAVKRAQAQAARFQHKAEHEEEALRKSQEESAADLAVAKAVGADSGADAGAKKQHVVQALRGSAAQQQQHSLQQQQSAAVAAAEASASGGLAAPAPQAPALKKGDPSLTDLEALLDPKKSASVAAKIRSEDPGAPVLTASGAGDFLHSETAAGAKSLDQILEGADRSDGLEDGSISNVLADYMGHGSSRQRENEEILRTQKALATFPGQASADTLLNPPSTAASSPALKTAGVSTGGGGGAGLSSSERSQLLKLEKKDGLSRSIRVTSNGAKTREFNHFMQHFEQVGVQANAAMANMYKHRQQEHAAAAAVKKIQAKQDKAEAQSDSALLTITSILGKYNGMSLLSDPKIAKTLHESPKA